MNEGAASTESEANIASELAYELWNQIVLFEDPMWRFGAEVCFSAALFSMAYIFFKSIGSDKTALWAKLSKICMACKGQPYEKFTKLVFAIFFVALGFIVMGRSAGVLMAHVKNSSQHLADHPISRSVLEFGSFKVEWGEAPSGGNDGIEASSLVEAYAGVLLGVLALGGLVLQFWQIRAQQQEFRHTLEINMCEQELDRLRRSFDTILPDGMKKGYRSKAQDYQWLLSAYTKRCQQESEDIDLIFTLAAQQLIEAMLSNERRLEVLNVSHSVSN